MRSLITFARLATAVVTLVALVAAARPCEADAALYRVHLRDGRTLLSYGEFARVGDRVVFSLPLAPLTADPRLQLVSLPASVVDWAATDRSTESARAGRYAAARGEADYAEMSAAVARQLNDIALAPNAAARLTIAEQARRVLSEWPATHYSYRASDVRQWLGILDEIIIELRAATGARQFDLSLVAAEPDALPPEPAPPPPGLRDVVEQALTAASLVDPPDRIALLRSALDLARAPQAAGDGTWAVLLASRAASELDAEMRVERAYGRLFSRAAQQAHMRVAAGDVRGVEGVIRAVVVADEKLGRCRPQEIAGFLAALDEQLESARQARLARDQWNERARFYSAYARELRPVLDQLRRVRGGLDEIRALAGPDARALASLDERVTRAAAALAQRVPPTEMAGTHASLGSAVQLAANAVRLRREAVRSGDLRLAWNASSAAAGSLLLTRRAREDLEALLAGPRLR